MSPNSKTVKPSIMGAILAGGKSRRMGADKAFVPLSRSTMVGCVVKRVQPQVDRLIINANTLDVRYKSLGLPVYADRKKTFLGPLAGILCAMEAAANYPFVFTTSVDCPLVPLYTVKRLYAAIVKKDDVSIVRACSKNRHHPTIALWRTDLRKDLHTAIFDDNCRKIDDFSRRHTVVDVNFPVDEIDVFFNVNTKQDLQKVQHVLREC